MTVNDLHIKIFCDGVRDALDLRDTIAQYPFLQGFTTNPTLMRKAGVTNYERWARELLAATDLPISFEVIADSFASMDRQAETIALWSKHAYVKIPITTTQGISTTPLIRQLSITGIKVNVTAVMTTQQIEDAARALRGGVPSYLSVFAGRIADTGRNPEEHIEDALQFTDSSQTEVIWASPREVWNVVQADACGCDIITCTPDLLAKLSLLGKDLAAHSLDTVKMFYEDAQKAGLTL